MKIPSFFSCYGHHMLLLSGLLMNLFVLPAQAQTKPQQYLQAYSMQPEACNGIDDDGDGLIDEDCNAQPKVATAGHNITGTDAKEHAPGSYFDVAVTPNPSKETCRVFLKGSNTQEKVSLKIFDENGRLLEVRDNLSIGQTVIIDNKFAQGLYLIEVVQGKKTKTVKMIKQ